MPSGVMDRTGVDALLSAVATLATFRDLDSLRRHTLNIVPSLVSANSISWNEVDVDHGRVEAIMEPHVVTEELADAFVEHIGDHPVIANHAKTGDGRPLAISDFLSASTFRSTGLYRHFYREIGTEDQMSFILPDPRMIIGVALNRERRGFTEGERHMLNALRPHLAQAYRNAEDFSRMQRSLAGMEVLVEQDGDGLLLVDRQGFTEYVTPRCLDSFGRWFGGWVGGAVPEVVREWLLPVSKPQAPVKPLVMDRGSAHLLIRRVPVPDGVALLVSEVQGDRAAALLGRLGLTRREVEVLLLLTDGRTVAATAAHLGISRRTVEKHVQHIYDKLGLENRVAATNLVRQLERTPNPTLGAA